MQYSLFISKFQYITEFQKLHKFTPRLFVPHLQIGDRGLAEWIGLQDLRGPVRKISAVQRINFKIIPVRDRING